jgi:hypothetical protein
MSRTGDALAAPRKLVLLEDRITSQGKKLEQLALDTVEMDKRLATLEGRMEGFWLLQRPSAAAPAARPSGSKTTRRNRHFCRPGRGRSGSFPLTRSPGSRWSS